MFKLLFVDDDEKILKSFNYFFRKDFEISFANNGKEAIEMIKTNHYDTIVSDLGMLEGNGLELKDFLKKNKNETPFIVVSGQINKDASMAFANLNVSYIFEKPVNLDLLKNEIHNQINLYNEKKNEHKMAHIGKNSGQILHDINNNLGVIMLASQLGSSKIDDSTKILKMFNNSYNACEKIIKIIEKYKHLTSKDLIVNNVDVELLVTRLKNELELYSSGSNGVINNVVINVKNLSGVISVDLDLIVQVFLNLASNSKDVYMSLNKKDIIEIDIDVVDNYVNLIFTDFGGKIPDHIKNTLFKESKTSKGENGTGKGLIYCKDLLEMHFGKIMLNESSENGTSFLIQIPLCKK